MRRYAYGLLGFVWLWFSAGDAPAQEMYRWTDKSGKVHFSNIAPKGGEANAISTTPGHEGEASNPEPATLPEGAPAPAPQPQASDKPGKHADLSEQDFSAQVSATRVRLKRELQRAKEQSREAGEKVEAMKKEHDQPARVGLEILQKAYGPDQHEASEEEELRKQKETADQRAKEIRKQYSELRDEAVKRFGQQPSWWLPIE